MTVTVSRSGPSLLEVGSTFAGYRIEEVLDGRPSAGAVYLATGLDSGRPQARAPWLPVALKVFDVDPDVPPWSLGVGDMARLQATLHHPSVVPIYEVGSSPAPFMSMGLVRGPSLADWLALRQLDDAAVLEIGRRVASALDAAREHGLAYRDLRPGRVLLAGGHPNQATLGDFGAGRPEDVRADVASNVADLASVLFQGLTVEAPEHDARPLRELRGDLPAELEDVLARALGDDPAQRPGSAGELMRAVAAAYPDPGGTAARAKASREGGRRAAPRPSPRALAIGAVLCSAAVVGAIVGSSGAPDPAGRADRAQTLDTGSLSVRYPAGWERAETVPAIPGLELRDGVALTPASVQPTAPAGRAVVLGSIGPWDPESLSRRPASSRRELVDLGAFQGYRYSGVTPAGSARAGAVYVLRTSAGAVAVGCIAPPGADAFIADCERVASTVGVKGASPVPVAPSASYRQALERTISALAAARVPNRQRLQAAGSGVGQAAAAQRISRAYRAARRSAAGLALPAAPRLHSAIVAALGSAADGYGQLAAAARRADQPGWDSGRALVLSSERELEQRLAELRRLY